MRNIILGVLSLFLLSLNVNAQLRLPAVLSDGMVLQQKDSVTIWGWGNPSERININPSWNNSSYTATVSNGATWKTKILTPQAGGPYTITFSGSRKIVLKDVYIGEVWVCSGQSNMEWSYLNGLKDIAQELPTCYNPVIRFFHIPKTTSDYPQDDLNAEWEVCDSNSLKSFSAIGYFFGKKLNKELGVPVGLINSSWGGTPAEVWTPKDVVSLDDELSASAGQLRITAWWPKDPGLCFNAMIEPITNFNIAGTIWYQGEGNTTNNSTYNKLFTSMISAWRNAWKKDFPFYYVQIAPFKYGLNNVGALIQEAQTRSMSLPNTGMVVVTDLIDSVTNIHPSNKHDVGLRLANWALAETYNKKGIVYKSPAYKSKSIDKNKIVLSFRDVPNGFKANEAITGFYIFDMKEEVWLHAQAKFQNDKIIVWNDKAVSPLHVRYGFGNTIIGNVFSKEGLPLCPFRTDNFEIDQGPVK